jgi:hypothetical protein
MTRQQLLKLRSSLGFSQNVLQYMGTFSRERNRPAPDWPNLGDNLSAGRFCIENLDLVKPNPAGCTMTAKTKGIKPPKFKGVGKGSFCGNEDEVGNLFGLVWVKSAEVPTPTPSPSATPSPTVHPSGFWVYVDWTNYKNSRSKHQKWDQLS